MCSCAGKVSPPNRRRSAGYPASPASLDWLRSQRPDLVPRYEELYARGAFLPNGERERIGRLLATSRRRAGVGDSGWRKGVRRSREIARISRQRESAQREPEEELTRQNRLF